MRTFSLGVLVTSSVGDEGLRPELLSTLAGRIAACGADALFVTSSMANGVEVVTALAATAASNDLVLGAVISLASGRNPAIVVKMATTLALLAPGRSAVILEADRSADPSDLLDALEVSVSLRDHGPVRAGGARFFIRDAYNEPRPTAADALGIGVILDGGTPRPAVPCDVVLSRVLEGSRRSADPTVVALFDAATPLGDVPTPLVVQVDGNSLDRVVEAVARVAGRRK